AKKRKTDIPAPIGLKWDSQHYSCSYDAIIGPMYTLWEENGPRWTDLFAEHSVFARELGLGFQAVRDKTRKLEVVRTSVRRLLHASSPETFAYGHFLVDIDDLALTMFGQNCWATTQTKCTKCGNVALSDASFPGAITIVTDRRLHTKFGTDYSVSHWFADRKMRKSRKTCSCGNGMVRVTMWDAAPPCIYLSLADHTINIDTALTVNVGADCFRYALRGVIYGGDEHFTARILKASGEMWYHDGIETGKRTEYQGVVHSQSPEFLNTC
ncbi:hypothetical protein B0H10DRAFT_1687060, partial [Mycena sp. CBHHK59/15]